MNNHYQPRVSFRAFAWLFLIFLLFLSAGTALAATNMDYVEGNVLVRFNTLKTDADIQALAGRHNASLKRHFHQLSAHDGKSLCLLHSDVKSTATLLAELRTEPGVAYAEPDYRRYVTDLRTPNDPFFNQLWNLQNTGQSIVGGTGTSNDDISFLKAWGLARPSTNEVVVAVIDTGLDITHPDIVSNLWTNPGLNDGYSGDVHGYDFALNTGALTDSGFHGTHVCGTIAATGNNGTGIIGVDFTAHIMMLKVSTDGESILTSAELSALDYIAKVKSLGVNVVSVNASYGGGSSSSSESSAIQTLGSEGIIFCAAAGNSSSDNDTTPFYPANYRLSNMIVVAATDQNDALASFSNYGAGTVDLAAPGVNIFSLLPMNLTATNASVTESNNVYLALPMDFAGTTSSNGISGPVYYCNLGGSSGDFPSGVPNFIALIQRGTYTFAVKVQNAMAAGASAAIIFNNAAGNFEGTLGSAGTWIPAVSLSQADGQTLGATLPATATVFNGPDPSLHYQFLSGTSMATPHVAGAVAFAALNFPTESVTQRIQRILTNTTPVASLSGVVITGGRLNLAKIVDTDGNGLPDWWEQQYFGHLTGTDPNADPDQDGENNLAEFLAGTIPTNALSVFKLNNPAAAQTGFILQWPSVAGRYYNILRYTNLVTDPGTLVQTNITATPPLNLFTDTPPVSVKNAFYRLQLDP